VGCIEEQCNWHLHQCTLKCGARRCSSFVRADAGGTSAGGNAGGNDQREGDLLQLLLLTHHGECWLEGEGCCHQEVEPNDQCGIVSPAAEHNTRQSDPTAWIAESDYVHAATADDITMQAVLDDSGVPADLQGHVFLVGHVLEVHLVQREVIEVLLKQPPSQAGTLGCHTAALLC
jgi:hypothetical protein